MGYVPEFSREMELLSVGGVASPESGFTSLDVGYQQRPDKRVFRFPVGLKRLYFDLLRSSAMPFTGYTRSADMTMRSIYNAERDRGRGRSMGVIQPGVSPSVVDDMRANAGVVYAGGPGVAGNVTPFMNGTIPVGWNEAQN